MNAAELILERLAAYMPRIEEAMGDVSEEDLMRQPGPNDNPIGWLMWHMTRFEDLTIAHISDADQVWTGGGWPEKFGASPDPRETGAGHTMEQVMTLKPTKNALMGYCRAVREKTIAHLGDLADADLDREIDDFSGNRKIAAGLLLGRFFGDTVSHIGQIVYLRGHFRGWGRYGR